LARLRRLTGDANLCDWPMTAFNFRMHAGGGCKPLLPLADNIIEQDADVAL
jgi:hypothetical protein